MFIYRYISDQINYPITEKCYTINTILVVKGIKEYQKKQKLIKFLISKGYEYELILDSLEAKK